MVKLNIGAYSTAVHESWEEVISTGKYLEIIAILSSSLSKDEAKQKLISYYLNGSDIDIPESLIDSASAKIIDEVYPLFNYIFDKVFVINPIPQFYFKGRKYVGPSEKLLPQTGAEMEECAWAYFEYKKTNDEKYLNHLIAVLYRPSKLFTRQKDKRKAFKKDAVEDRAIKLASIHPLLKQGIKFFYENCEVWWKDTYSKLYEGSETSTEKVDSLGVSRLVRALAGQKRGTVDMVRLIDRDEIYFELFELNREADEAKENS